MTADDAHAALQRGLEAQRTAVTDEIENAIRLNSEMALVLIALELREIRGLYFDLNPVTVTSRRRADACRGGHGR